MSGVAAGQTHEEARYGDSGERAPSTRSPVSSPLPQKRTLAALCPSARPPYSAPRHPRPHKVAEAAPSRPSPCALTSHEGDVGVDALPLDGVVVAHHRRLRAGGVRHQRALHLRRADAVPAHVDHVVHPARDPVVAVRVAPAAVACENSGRAVGVKWVRRGGGGCGGCGCGCGCGVAWQPRHPSAVQCHAAPRQLHPLPGAWSRRGAWSQEPPSPPTLFPTLYPCACTLPPLPHPYTQHALYTHAHALNTHTPCEPHDAPVK